VILRLVDWVKSCRSFEVVLQEAKKKKAAVRGLLDSIMKALLCFEILITTVRHGVTSMRLKSS
jgi:hypothetical protein